jgi:hypothetical protein
VPVTVWGTASGQNCQVMVGAVLALKSGRLSADCEVPAASAIPRGNPARTVSGPDPVPSEDQCRPPERAPRRIAPGRDSRRQ